MELRETQRRLVQALDRNCSGDTLAAACALLQRRPGLHEVERIRIYRNNAISAQVSALGGIYPVIAILLGPDCFGAVARQYVARYPSTEADLNGYGETFPSYLADLISNRPEYSSLPYLPDLARLERYWHAVYFCRDDASFDFQAFDQACRVPTLEIRLLLSHSLSLLESSYPIHALWDLNRNGQGDTSVPAQEGMQRLCIFRQGYEPRIERLDSVSFRMLQACREGQTLATLIQSEADAQCLPTMIQRGWISGFVGDLNVYP